MWAFGKVEDLESFRDRYGVFSIYLADGYDMQAISEIMETKLGFDVDVEDRWHILIPHRDGKLTKDSYLVAREFGVELSTSLVKNLSISPNDLPALAFPESNGQENLFLIKLGGMSRGEVIKTIKEIAEIVNRPRPKGRGVVAFRTEVVAEIRAYAAGKKILGIGVKVGKGAANILGIISSLLSLGGGGT